MELCVALSTRNGRSMLDSRLPGLQMPYSLETWKKSEMLAGVRARRLGLLPCRQHPREANSLRSFKYPL